MKKRFMEEELPESYGIIERQLMALFYCGVYITNADLVEIGAEMGYEYGLKNRVSLLKDLMHDAYEEGRVPEMLRHLTRLLQERAGEYQRLAGDFPAAAGILHEMIQKARSTAMLMQREMRSDPYA